MFGKTGTGKSSLCNILEGKKHDADYFKTSSDPTSCTQKTKVADVNWIGDPNFPISLIDTIGFDDSSEDHEIIAELVVKLKHRCDHINLFVLAVNGQDPRLDGSLLEMIKIFEGMFSGDFWNQVVLVFTKICMSEGDKKRREEDNERSDDELAAKFIKKLEGEFKDCTGLRYLYMDASYKKKDYYEKAAFDSACTKLYNILEESKELPTDNVKQVAIERAILQEKIEKAEKEEELIRKVFFSASIAYLTAARAAHAVNFYEPIATRVGKMAFVAVTGIAQWGRAVMSRVIYDKPKAKGNETDGN